jgi:hypothetical protein
VIYCCLVRGDIVGLVLIPILKYQGTQLASLIVKNHYLVESPYNPDMIRTELFYPSTHSTTGRARGEYVLLRWTSPVDYVSSSKALMRDVLSRRGIAEPSSLTGTTACGRGAPVETGIIPPFLPALSYCKPLLFLLFQL